MDYFVPLSANDSLDRAQEFFATGWPYGGQFARNGNIVRCTIQLRDGVLRAALNFLTAGGMKPRTQTTQVIARSEDGGCALTVTADNEQHESTTKQWAKQELGAQPKEWAKV